MDKLPQYIADEYESPYDNLDPRLWNAAVEAERARLDPAEEAIQRQFHFDAPRFALSGGDSQECFRILDAMLMQPDDPLYRSPQAAAESIMLMRPPGSEVPFSTEDRTQEAFYYGLLFSSFHIAKQISAEDEESQDKLVELIKYVQNMDDHDVLPTFGYCAHDSDHYEYGDQEKAEELNFHAFLARLTRESVYNFSLYMSWILNRASGRSHREYANGEVVWMSQWLSLAGKELFLRNNDLWEDGKTKLLAAPPSARMTYEDKEICLEILNLMAAVEREAPNT
ncbi:uncharacterized protein LY89DRAFT_743802 [Mollisia scopiformis]|uniref:Uncharacterized protein n=1 Tax=Mollisia scopiformis TaxID=149040 RepID=A0A132B482_MOLSC|nr:uncharacterized protein LY89DRAFT_743802 [Mollisia scopiformis]KUJ06477.1 hypothetical protein LY89DRAFT_743802 [Mollisia scopiformis]